MHNAYSDQELQAIVAPTGGRCYVHPTCTLEVQRWGNGAPYFTCGRGHYLSPEYFVARTQKLTVEGAAHYLEDLLGRPVEPHDSDFRWAPLRLPRVSQDGFTPGGSSYWSSRGITDVTLGVYGVGALNGVPAIPFWDVFGEQVGWFTRNPDVPPNTSGLPHNVKCSHAPVGHLPWEHHKLHCPPTPKPVDQTFVPVTEGVLDAMKCMDAGFWAVAANGASLSLTQIAELRVLTRNVLLFADNDKAGRRMLSSPGVRSGILPFFNVQVCVASGGKDPNAMDLSDVRSLLSCVSFST